MKRASFGVNGIRTAVEGGARSQSSTYAHKENHMQIKKQSVVRKPSKRIADSRKIRFGGGSAPAKLARSADAAVADSRTVRFGGGSAPACRRK